MNERAEGERIVSGPLSNAEAAEVDEGQPARPGSPTVERYPSRVADVGGTEVRRALPHRQRRTIGAWCFADHFGPVAGADGALQIGPHPHIGLQTVTWLTAGEVLHHDSLGSERLIRPGQLNLMTAGRGVAHAEEPQPGAPAPPIQHGAQLWVALPDATRHGEPAFEHHASLPVVDLGGLVATVLVGKLAGARSPARTDTPLVGAALAGADRLVDRPAVTQLDPAFEHGLIVLAGAISVDAQTVRPGELAYLGLGRDELTVRPLAPSTEALLLGGEPFPQPPLMWWNFVARTWDEIRQARDDWESGADRFGPVTSRLDRVPAPPLPPGR